MLIKKTLWPLREPALLVDDRTSANGSPTELMKVVEHDVVAVEYAALHHEACTVEHVVAVCLDDNLDTGGGRARAQFSDPGLAARM